MSGARTARRVISGVLALVVVGGVAYGAAALLSPIPNLHVEQTLRPPADTAWSQSVTLPAVGSTAVLAPSGSLISAGSTEARPIAGIAKVILVSVVLATEPLLPGSPGAAITIDQAALGRYRELDAAGARTVAVQFGQTWTRRDLIAATLVGSGNNTAELLIDAVFGNLDSYLAAARVWLDEKGLSSTSVADGTGLDPASSSTAVELARIGQLALQDPLLSELLTSRPRETSAGARYADEAGFLASRGTIGLARTYTDSAGVCVLLALPVGDETIIIAMLGQPAYPAAESTMSAVIEATREAVRDVEIIAAGDVVAVARSVWGQSTEYLAAGSISVSSTEIDGLGVRIDPAARSTLLRGADVGSLVITAGGVEQSVRLEAGGTITEPGVAWRFSDPLTVLGRWTR